MKKTLLTSLLFLLLVVSIQEPSFASYTETTVNINKYYDVAGNADLSCYEDPYILKVANATIYSVNLSYSYSGTKDEAYFYLSNGGNNFLHVTGSKNESKTNVNYVLGNSKQYGFSGFWRDQSNLSFTFNSVVIRHYYIDNISLQQNNNGHVEITVTQNQPNTSLDYVIYNTNTGSHIATVTSQNNSTFKVYDTNPAIGVANRYKVTCLFNFATFGDSGHEIYSPYIYVPVDTQIYDAVKDANGSALSEARKAVTAANNARTSADSATTAANNAYNKATTAASNTSYNNKTSGYWSYYGYSKANSANSNASYIRNTQLPNMENELNNLKGGITNLSSQVTNIENNMADDSTPPVIIATKGRNSATCTTGSTFDVEIQAIDNSSSNIEFRVKADTGSWSSWKSVSSYATAANISGSRAHTIYIEAKDPSGNVSTGTLTIFKI